MILWQKGTNLSITPRKMFKVNLFVSDMNILTLQTKYMVFFLIVSEPSLSLVERNQSFHKRFVLGSKIFILIMF